LNEIDTGRLFEPIARAQRVALAVSGGPDSLALMLLAHSWATDRAAPELVVYTVDHRLRPEAANEAAMVVAEAAKLGLQARVLVWNDDKPETGIQAAARKARYRLMAGAMHEDGAEFALTAHHLGDQAETILMRLAHGSGVEGLRGIDRFAQIEGCRLFRPLLGFEPQDLLKLVRDRGLTPAADPSNSDRHYERVRWRQMMPHLAELGLDLGRFADFATRMADADDLIGLEADRAFAGLVYSGGGGAELPHAGVTALPRAIGVRLLVKVLRAVGGDRKPHALKAVEALHARLAARLPLKPSTLHGCVISSDGVTISVVREGARRNASVLISN
jgi:tRNA(Ile)-lysidine synthase